MFFIDPKKGLGIIHNQLEQAAREKIKEFKILYKNDGSPLEFHCFTNAKKIRKFDFQDDRNILVPTMKRMIELKLNAKYVLTGFVVEYNENEVLLKVGFLNSENEKELQTLKI